MAFRAHRFAVSCTLDVASRARAAAASSLPSRTRVGVGAATLFRRGLIDAQDAGTVVRVGKQDHWATFMYGRERQLLIQVVNAAQEGNPDSVLDAMDTFWAHHFGMKGTSTWTIRKEILDQTMKDKSPSSCLELGTYCGYSALRIARNLPASGRLVSIDVDPLFGAIASRIVEYAGLSDKVKILTGTVGTKTEKIARCFSSGRADFVLCDHSKDLFVSDLQLLERAGIAGPGTVIMGDTTIYPGEAEAQGGNEFLSYMKANEKFLVQQHVGTEGKEASGITVVGWQHIV